MQAKREEIRDGLLVILAASRELSPDTDGELADTFLERLSQDTRRHGHLMRHTTVPGSGVHLGLAALAAASIVLLPLIMWSSSHTKPEPVYMAGWLIMIGAAIAASVVLAYRVIRGPVREYLPIAGLPR